MYSKKNIILYNIAFHNKGIYYQQDSNLRVLST